MPPGDSEPAGVGGAPLLLQRDASASVAAAAAAVSGAPLPQQPGAAGGGGGGAAAAGATAAADGGVAGHGSAASAPTVSSSDDALVADLLALMADSGADFSRTFRRLAGVPMPLPRGSCDGAAAAAGSSSSSPDDDDFGGFLSATLAELPGPMEMATGVAPTMPEENVQVRLTD